MTGLRHILLAEDNANDAELTLAALKTNRVLNDVVITRDGAETLDYLCRRNAYANREGANPVLMLLDLKMPKVDGLEVLRQVKSNDQLKSIPIVVLTSSREEHDVVASYDRGVNAYVVKPVDFHDFVNAVKLLGGFWAVVNEPPPVR
jgi:CheY-like chemotaxis protein